MRGRNGTRARRTRGRWTQDLRSGRDQRRHNGVENTFELLRVVDVEEQEQLLKLPHITRIIKNQTVHIVYWLVLLLVGSSWISQHRHLPTRLAKDYGPR